MPERAKQASYSTRFDARQAPVSTVSQITNQRSSSSTPTARKANATSTGPPNKNNEKKSSRIESKLSNEGKMVKYKSLEDIPDGFSTDINPKKPESFKSVRNHDDDDNYWNTDYPDNSNHTITSSRLLSENARVGTKMRIETEEKSEQSDDEELTAMYQNISSNRHTSSQLPSQPAYDYNKHDKSSEAQRSLPLLPAEVDNKSIASQIKSPRYHKGVVKGDPLDTDDSDYSKDISLSPIQANTKLVFKDNGIDKQSPIRLHSIYNPSIPALPYETNYQYHQSTEEVKFEPELEKEKLFFSKEPRKIEFKPYSLEQYRMIRPKEYVEISKIKPDLNTDELIAKRANLQRIKEFSKNLKKYNESNLHQQPKLPPATEQQEINKSDNKIHSKRSKALEFAKNISKPKLKEKGFDGELIEELSNKGSDRNNSLGYAIASDGVDKDVYGLSIYESQKIAELEMKHNEKKKHIEAIKKSIGMK